MKELVSIIMPSYNTADYIGEAIESVIQQTYTNWQLIIIDDCSSDDTDGVVSRFLQDSRILYKKNARRMGAAESRNRALKLASGRWIAFLDSDDFWEKEKIEKQLNFMELHEYHFSYTEYEIINEESKEVGTRISGPSKINKMGMYCYCWPGCLTVMYDADYVGLIQIDDIRKNNDYAMWLRVCKKANCYLLKEELAKYRRRVGSISNHTYISLIKWHYLLWRNVEKHSRFMSIVLTCLNLVFGLCKKIVYTKKWI